jgi:hypothetical protein
MSGGVIPSEAFNEQLKRTVRETMRREHSTQRPRARWHKKGIGGGGGASSCNSCCTSVQTGNMLHPDLASGFNETTRDWIAQSACGDAIASVTIPNASGSLRLVWPGGTPTLTYEDTDDTFVFEITDDCTILEPDGTDVTGSTSFEAFITMDFAALTVVISWEEL